MPNAKVKIRPVSKRKVVAEWPFRENGAERVETALVKAVFCHVKVIVLLTWAVCVQ